MKDPTVWRAKYYLEQT